MRIRIVELLVLAGLATAACGSGSVDVSLPTAPLPTEISSDGPSETAPPPGTAVTVPNVDTAISDRPAAPDFTLELGEGGSFTLSQGEKPVYLIFWAEWCPRCRRELPVVDRLAAEYSDRIDFVAPAWKSDFESTERRAHELFLSREIQWGLDEAEDIFALYAVPYQPVTVLIAPDGTVVETWLGVRDADEIRSAVENLVSFAG